MGTAFSRLPWTSRRNPCYRCAGRSSSHHRVYLDTSAEDPFRQQEHNCATYLARPSPTRRPLPSRRRPGPITSRQHHLARVQQPLEAVPVSIRAMLTVTRPDQGADTRLQHGTDFSTATEPSHRLVDTDAVSHIHIGGRSTSCMPVSPSAARPICACPSPFPAQVSPQRHRVKVQPAHLHKRCSRCWRSSQSPKQQEHPVLHRRRPRCWPSPRHFHLLLVHLALLYNKVHRALRPR